jgi:WD40 repeat protein
VSASQDARVLVWSVAALVDESNTNVTPYAIFSDHVQPVTSIKLSSSPRSCISSFPSSTRLLSSSVDGTVKLWDMRSRSLVATWAFQGPINHLSVETGFRAFFVALRARHDDEVDTIEGDEVEEQAKLQEWDMVRRIDLYGSQSEDSVSSSSALTRGKGKLIWRPKDSTTRITAMTLSTTASHLLIGTSEAQLHVIDVASSLMIRSASLVPTGNLTTELNVSGLQTFLYQDGNSPLAGSMRKSSNSSNSSKWDICEKLQRTRDDEAPFAMRLPRGRAKQIANLLTPPSLASQSRQPSNILRGDSSSSTKNKEDLQAAQRQISKLEAENEKLNDLLRRAQKTNAGLWEKVVKETISTKAD